MIDPGFWFEEWRSCPLGPGALNVWVLRQDGPAAPLQVLSQHLWRGGSTREEPAVAGAVPPLSQIVTSMTTREVRCDDGPPLRWTMPLKGRRTVGAVSAILTAEGPWRQAQLLWLRRFATRLESLLDGLPPQNEDVRSKDMPQPTLFCWPIPTRPIREDRARLPRGTQALPMPVAVPSVPDLIAASVEMIECCESALAVARSGVNVLIHGESGTGKEVLARAVHEASPRREAPFIGVNCAALPESLFESELFGHKAGAFTGAGREKTGLLEAANGGTLFLDEIGDMPVSLQIKLLRVMQERRLRRIGDLRDRAVDVRFVAASHRDLDEEVAHGRFRLDLYYRLKVVRLVIPPLRNRPEDIAPLLAYFLGKAGKETFNLGIEHEALDALQRYRWPGNVRELENEVSRWLALHGDADRIRLDDLSLEVRRARNPSVDPSDLGTLRSMDEATEMLERYLIRKAISACRGRKSDAARRLGLSRQGLYKKIRRYGMVDLLQPAV